MSAIGNDAPENDTAFANDDAAIDAFLSKWKVPDAEKPSGSVEEEKKEETAAPEKEEEAEAPAEKPEAEAEAEGSEQAEETEEEKAYADDGAYVKIKVGDEEHEVPVKDLGRLFGQEKALTQKSMEVATQRKAADEQLARNVAATSELLKRAQARFEPYSKIDFLLAAKEHSAEDFTNLRTAATAAYEDVQFLQQNLDGHFRAIQQSQQGQLVEQAKEAIKILGGPVDQGGIEGWNEKLYDDLRSFAVGQGLNQDIVNNLVDPAAIRLLHSAMLYERGKSKVVTTKVNKTPKKVVKTTRQPEQPGSKDRSRADAAMKNLRSLGTDDAAIDALLARWGAGDDNQ